MIVFAVHSTLLWLLRFPKLRCACDDRYDVLPLFWVPEEGAQRREHQDGVPYRQRIRQTFMQATPGEVIDFDEIRRTINELEERYRIKGIACKMRLPND